jgi:hypothetical protein
VNGVDVQRTARALAGDSFGVDAMKATASDTKQCSSLKRSATLKKVVKTTKLKTPRNMGIPAWLLIGHAASDSPHRNHGAWWLALFLLMSCACPLGHCRVLEKSKSKYHRQQTRCRCSSIREPLPVSLLHCVARRPQTMEQPTKHESQQLLTKFKNKGTANKVSPFHALIHSSPRHALIVVPKTLLGAQCPLRYTSVSTAALSTEILVFTSLS